MNEPERTLSIERRVWINGKSVSGCVPLTNMTKKPFPISCPLDDAGRLYGSADRVLDIIKLERLALGAIFIVRRFKWMESRCGSIA